MIGVHTCKTHGISLAVKKKISYCYFIAAIKEDFFLKSVCDYYNYKNKTLPPKKKKFVNLYYPKDSSQIKTINEKFRNIALDKFYFKKVRVSTLNNLIKQTKFYEKKIDFLNIDCEGEDYEVLKSLDLKIYRPRLICIEINILSVDNIKKSKVYKYLVKNGYRKKYSFINSHIFIEH